MASASKRYWWIWIGALPVALWAALRVLAIDNGFPLATLMPFTPYVAIGALFVAGIALALENWPAATLAGLAFVALTAVILPRTIGDGTVRPEGHRTLSILAANVHHGTADPEELVALVRRTHAEVLSVEELTPSFARGLERAGIGRYFSVAELKTHPGASGSGIYSRYPLRPLPAPARFEFHMPYAELKLPGGGRLRFVSAHPYPPEPHQVTEWEEALAGLPSAGRGAPWILAGDFNATLDQSQFRDLVDRGYRDAGEVAGKGLEPTFPQEGHLIPPITIDHVLVDERLGIVEYEVEPLPGSDHRAVHAVVRLP